MPDDLFDEKLQIVQYLACDKQLVFEGMGGEGKGGVLEWIYLRVCAMNLLRLHVSAIGHRGEWWGWLRQPLGQRVYKKWAWNADLQRSAMRKMGS